MADGLVPVVVSPVPFSRQIHDLTVREGATVLAMLVEAVRSGKLAATDLSRVTIYVDGERLQREEALETILSAGQIINVVVEPLGGGGGGGKDIGQIVLTIAVIVASAWVGGPTGPLAAMSALVRTVASAAVMAIGQAAIGALFQPDRDAQAKANDRYALQSASNQYRPWSPFPMALGEVIVAPDLAVKTFTQSRGDDVWIYGILGLHYGACEVSEEKIGDTLASTMGAGDVQFVRHLTPGPRTFQLYPNDVDQLDLTEELEATTGSATPVLRAGSAEGEKFEFDFFLPQGLHFQKDDGRVITAAVTMTVRYRAIDEDGQPIGGGAWLNGLTVPLSSTTKEPWRVTRALTLPLGRYEFEIKRSTKPDGNEKRRDQVALTAIRSIAFRKPITDETLSVIEFAVRATALNQGTLAPITCRIKPVCQTWNAGEGAWGAPQATSNPAALTRWLLSGPAPVRPEPPARVDVGLRAWSELCETYDWTSNVYLTELKTQAEAMALLEQAGRASLFWDGTQIVASPWVEKPSPVQMFAGDNLRDHKWALTYVEPVHALRVEFQNLDQAGEPDELYVYADGYAETAGDGKEAAVLIEALRIEGQRTEERAYRDGRWELGRRKHQRRIDTWACDIEQLACRYGSRVRLAWQRVDGGASARVRVRRWSGSLVSGLRLTQPVTMLPGESYAVDLRLVDGVDAAVPIVNAATTEPVTTRDITFASPRTESTAPRGGDLVAFGVATKVSEDVEIIGIEPGEGLTATLTGIRYVAPLLIAGETGPIPELQTRLTRVRAASPPPPRLLGVQPDPSGVRVSFEMPPWSGSPIAGFSARWRPTPTEGNETGWVSLQALGRSAMTLVTPAIRALPVAPDDVEGRTLIDVEVRAFTEAGQSSPEPLLVTAIEVREDPWPPVDLLVTPATRISGEDGSSHGVLHVSATPLAAADGVDMVVEVRSEPLSGGPGDWQPASRPLPAANPQGDLLGLLTGERYRTRAAWRSAAGWLSEWADGGLATVPAASNVASDTRHVDGRPATDVAAEASQVPGLALTLAGAQLAIATHEAILNTAVTGLVAQVNALVPVVLHPTTGLQTRMGTVEAGVANGVSRLNALEATINTSTSGLAALVAGQATAISNLQTGKAEASTVNTLIARANATDLLLRPGANLLPNPTGGDGVKRWTPSGSGGWTTGSDGGGAYFRRAFPSASGLTGTLISDQFTGLVPGDVLTVSAVADLIGRTAGNTFIQLDFLTAGGVAIAGGSFARAFGNGSGPIVPFTGTAPAGTARAQVQIVLGGVSGDADADLRVRRIKVERGTVATPFSDEATLNAGGAVGLLAQFNALDTAVVNLATGKADVGRVATLEARASGPNNLTKATWFATDTSFSPWGYYESAVNFTPAVRNPANGYSVPGEGCIQISQGGRNAADPYANLAQFTLGVPVEPGKRYCFSAYTGAINCPLVVFFYFIDSVGTYLGEGTSDAAAVNNSEKSGSNPSAFSTLKRTKSFGTAPATATQAVLLLRKYDTVGAGTAESYAFFSRLMFGEVSATATDAPPWVDASASASIADIRAASASLEGRLESRALLQTTAGNQVSGMQLLAVSGPDVAYSTIDFWATAVRISNGGLGAISPFVVRDNVVRIQELMVDRVAVGASIVVGSRRLALAVQPFSVPCTDGVPISFGYNIGLTPEIVFLRDGALSTLGSNESYEFTPEAPTGTGFTPRLKIKTVGAPTNRAQGPGGTAAGPASHQFTLLGAPVGGNVSVRATGNIRSNFVNPNYTGGGGPPVLYPEPGYSDGYVQLGVFALVGSTWTQVGVIGVDPPLRSDSSDPPGVYNDAYDTGLQSFAVGAAATAVGIAQIYDGYGGSNVTNCSLAYQTASASGTRSATPNGELTTAMVYPRNAA